MAMLSILCLTSVHINWLVTHVHKSKSKTAQLTLFVVRVLLIKREKPFERTCTKLENHFFMISTQDFKSSAVDVIRTVLLIKREKPFEKKKDIFSWFQSAIFQYLETLWCMASKPWIRILKTYKSVVSLICD